MNQGIFFLDGSLLIKSFFELELKENLKLISKKLGDAPHLKKKKRIKRMFLIKIFLIKKNIKIFSYCFFFYFCLLEIKKIEN